VLLGGASLRSGGRQEPGRPGRSAASGSQHDPRPIVARAARMTPGSRSAEWARIEALGGT
jgi:hypothetical protein